MNVAILVAIGVNEDGRREIIGAAEGMKEEETSWLGFFRHLLERGLRGARLVIGDRCLGMVEATREAFPEAKTQRRIARFQRNVLSKVPHSKA